MATEITCPVCRFENISPDRDSCPQCDSDLSCFRLLDALSNGSDASSNPDSNPRQTDRTKRFFPVVGIIFVSIMISLLVYGVYHLKSAAGRVHGIERQVKDLVGMTKEIAEAITRDREIVQFQIPPRVKPDEIIPAKLPETSSARPVDGGLAAPQGTTLAELPEKMEEKISDVQAKEEAAELPASQDRNKKDEDKKECFRIYRADDDDTLWSISRDLYGAGFYYPVLMTHNPDLKVYEISSRSRVRYLCDKSLVPRIYRRITGKEQNRFYWKYKVRLGDTRQSIVDRYCLNQKDCIAEEYPLEPGMTIRVFLE